MLQEALAPVAVEPQATTAHDRGLEMLRWPTYAGSAYVAVHPLDAEVIAARGWLKVDGVKATVIHVNDKPFTNGKVGIEVDFNGQWERPHP